MELVTLDQKMRIRLPKKVSKALGLRSKEALSIDVKKGRIVISRPRRKRPMSPMLRDMIERPLHSRIPITSKLLEAMEEEQWST